MTKVVVDCNGYQRGEAAGEEVHQLLLRRFCQIEKQIGSATGSALSAHRLSPPVSFTSDSAFMVAIRMKGMMQNNGLTSIELLVDLFPWRQRRWHNPSHHREDKVYFVGVDPYPCPTHNPKWEATWPNYVLLWVEVAA